MPLSLVVISKLFVAVAASSSLSIILHEVSSLLLPHITRYNPVTITIAPKTLQNYVYNLIFHFGYGFKEKD